MGIISLFLAWWVRCDVYDGLIESYLPYVDVEIANDTVLVSDTFISHMLISGEVELDAQVRPFI